MRSISSILILALLSMPLLAQELPFKLEGEISYISSTNVYVKFENTDPVQAGDTLYRVREGELTPCLIVENKSSISCVCRALPDLELAVGDVVLFPARARQPEAADEPLTVEPEAGEDTVRTETGIAAREAPAERESGPAEYEATAEEKEKKIYKQDISGRISAASYSNFSPYGDLHRMRYGFSFRGDHLNNSPLSADLRVTFRHTANEWEEVQNNLSQALKIYSFALDYQFSDATNVTLGRKFNHRMSGMGAIDGLQLEHGTGHFTFGGIVGSRPDMKDYSINLDLLEAGIYASHQSAPGESYYQSTLAVAEQRNAGNIDRRFLYFQHSNALLGDLNLFTSFEFDLYEKIDQEENNTFNLTNLYVNLRYRFSRAFSINASYDARNNIIYYETYKSFIEQMIEEETRQGLRFGISLRPLRNLTFGANASWRFQKSDMNQSKNLNTYMNISRIPVLKASASLSANFLKTGYIDSEIYRLRLSRPLIENLLDADLYFKLVSYRYLYAEDPVNQKVMGANLNLRLSGDLGLYLYYEATLDERGNDITRFNTKIIQRF